MKPALLTSPRDSYPLAVISIVAIASFWKIFSIHDLIWDDNCWLQSFYATANLEQFLETGGKPLGHEALGSIIYWLWWLHKYTDFFFPVWHTLSLLTQIGSAIALFFLVKGLFKDERLAFFAAILFIVFHLDQALPFATIMNYRIGLLLSIISLYLTVRALESETNRRGLLALSALSAAPAHSVFIEQAVALEPGRLAIIAYFLYYTRNIEGTKLAKKSLLYWLPFVALMLPLIVIKLTNKPYGVYEGTYSLDPWFFLNWKQNLREISDLLLLEWLRFWKLSRFSEGIMPLLIFAGGIPFFMYVLGHLVPRPFPEHAPQRSAPHRWMTASTLHLANTYGVGIALLLPPLLMVKFAGLDLQLIGSQNSSHGILAQIGYAIILGKIAEQSFTSTISRKKPTRLWRFLPLASVLALGVYYNNIGLDLYQDSWKRQTLFWKTFVQRFPVLPERADFVIDAADGARLSDQRIHFDFEIGLNLLYARSSDPAEFRRYRVFTMEDYRNQAIKRGVPQLDDRPIERLTHWGRDVLDPRQFIVVIYRHGHLLIGPEIKRYVSDYHKLPYSNWVDHQFPDFSSSAGPYPLRDRLPGF